MRYFVGFLITIGLVILLIILLVGGGSNKIPTTNKPLSSYASTDAQAIMTIDGPVNANQDHIELRITVGRDQVSYEKMSGYDGNVVDSKLFTNSQSAYTEFLLALAHAGFTRGSRDKTLADDRGYCPLENRYIFELNQDGQQIERYWTSDCNTPKTYLGNRSLTITLFEKQIPGFEDIQTGLML